MGTTKRGSYSEGPSIRLIQIRSLYLTRDFRVSSLTSFCVLFFIHLIRSILQTSGLQLLLKPFSSPNLFVSLHFFFSSTMGLSKSEKAKRLLRVVKTLIFLITMLASLLIVSAPVFLVITDALLPSALISATSLKSNLSVNETLYVYFKNYDFRQSLIDIPLISILRSAVIFCSYWCCNGPRLSRGPYLVVTSLCSVVSIIFVSVKAPYVFDIGVETQGGEYGRGVEVGLFMSSMILAIGHMVVAYRISCRERRKLLVYKIDIEAVSARQKEFITYHKLLQDVRAK